MNPLYDEDGHGEPEMFGCFILSFMSLMAIMVVLVILMLLGV